MGTMSTYNKQAKKAAQRVKSNMRTLQKLSKADGTSDQYGPNGPMAALSISTVFPGAYDNDSTGIKSNLQDVFNTMYKKSKGASIQSRVDGLTDKGVNTLEYMYNKAKEYDGESDLEEFLGIEKQGKRGRPKGSTKPKTFLDTIKQQADKGEE